MIKIGDRYREKSAMYVGDQVVHHIVGIVEFQIVFRWYSKGKQQWRFRISTPELLEMYIENGIWEKLK